MFLIVEVWMSLWVFFLVFRGFFEREEFMVRGIFSMRILKLGLVFWIFFDVIIVCFIRFLILVLDGKSLFFLISFVVFMVLW